MRALLIDERAKAEIARVIAHAEKNKISQNELRERIEKGGPAIGDDPNHVCYLFDGFKVVFSIEEQPFGWSRHLSISVNDPNKVPHQAAAEMIMKEFGFTEPLKECYVYIEEEISPKPINIIGKI